MPLSPFRLPFLYPVLRLSRPTVTTIRRYRHGTAVEPIPTPTPAPDSTTNTSTPKDDVLSASTPSTPSIQPSTPLSPLTSSSSSNSSSTPVTPPKPTGGAAPSLSPREWTHHFDTYSVAASLTRSGFRPSQSAIIMKSIRSLLATNLDLAHNTLVSKSNVENESYLFHAACAELRNEVVAERKAELDALRAETAALQASYDELNQRFMEEIMALKEELNNMFNERKMANRAQMREMENRVQELNWKITVVIGAEVRSEVEGLRWTTTRRGLIAIGALAVFVVTSIRLSNEGKKDKKKSPSSEKRTDEGDTHDFGNRIVPTDVLAESLANPGPRSSSGASFVSLG